MTEKIADYFDLKVTDLMPPEDVAASPPEQEEAA